MCRGLRRPETAFVGRWIAYFLCAALWLVFCHAPAWAHKVMIFAWVEGDTVHTQSKLSGGRKAKNATVLVYDEEGNQLMEGKTDEQGEFSFKVPEKKTGLKIVLKASMGHMAEWKIPTAEITAVAPVSESSSAPESRKSKGSPVPTAVGLNRQEVKALIDESLDRKLAPIVKMLADQVDRGPTVSEVLGGLGYIFGLVGVALYFSNRRRKG